MCFSGGSPPPVPDESGDAESSSNIGAQANASGQALSNYTQAGSTAQNAQTSLAQGQLNTAGSQNLAAGAAGANEYTNTALPAANQNIAQSEAWGNAAGVAGAQAGAAAQTGQAYNAARLNNQRQLGSYGVDPSTMKSGALNLNANLSQAGATGNAAYTAGQNRQLQGINLTNQAVGTANNTAAVGAQYGSTGSSQLNSSTQLGNQTLATTTQAQLAPSQYDSTALQGYGEAANISSQGYQNALAGAQYSNTVNTGEAAGIGQGVGAIGGLVADYYSGADGGGIPTRGMRGQKMKRHRFDDGGDVGGGDNTNDTDAGPSTPADQQDMSTSGGNVASGHDGGGGYSDSSSNIPSDTTGMSQIAAPQQKGGTSTPVGLTPQQEQEAAQGAFMQGAVKGFGETYEAAADGGAIPRRSARPRRFDDGGSVAVPNISINAPERVAITQGGANTGQNPQANKSSSSGGGMGGMGGLGSMLGGMGGGGGGGGIGDSSSMGMGTGMSDFSDMDSGMGSAAGDFDWGSAADDVAEYAADGGSMGQRKKPMYGVPQRHQQGGVPPQVGIPGPWVAANGGPAPLPGQNQPSGMGRLPGFANGGGPSPSMGSPPGTFISQGASDGTGIDDQVPAKVSVGEYVIPADVVHAKGKEFFDKLVQRYHTPAHVQRQQMGMPQHGMPQRMH